MVVPHPVAQPFFEHKWTPDIIRDEGTGVITPPPDRVVGHGAHPGQTVERDHVANPMHPTPVLRVVPHPVEQAVLDNGGDSGVAFVKGAGRPFTDHTTVGAGAGDAGPGETIGREGIADEEAVVAINPLVPHPIAQSGGTSAFAGSGGGGGIAQDAGGGDDGLVKGTGDAGGAEDGATGEGAGDAGPGDAVGRGGEADGKGGAITAGIPHQVAGWGTDH
ncbi:MAG: hypothetical protein KatS3mg056_1998 [Chloroflexus sp.]|nr:MAG: hypothetical protein KatS3mg056_1998 [Chloroflexus sp.]